MWHTQTCIIWLPWRPIMWSIWGFVDSKLRSSPSVFIRTPTSGSDSNLNIWSVPSAWRIWDLIFCSAWNAMFWARENMKGYSVMHRHYWLTDWPTPWHRSIHEKPMTLGPITISAHIPLSRSAGSWRLVSPHSKSTAPDSRIGSLLGENSRSKLHRVEDATVRISSEAPCRSCINGRHTEWSYKDKICKEQFKKWSWPKERYFSYRTETLKILNKEYYSLLSTWLVYHRLLQHMFTNEGAKEHHSVGHWTVCSGCTTAVYHLKYMLCYDIWGYHTSAAEDSSLLGCNAVCFGQVVPRVLKECSTFTFRD